MKKSELREIIREEILNESAQADVAMALTQFLLEIPSREVALKYLKKASGRLILKPRSNGQNAEEDNDQIIKTYRELLKIVKDISK